MGVRRREGGLNCLSAVEAIGSARRRVRLRGRDHHVSIAFRLLKRLVVCVCTIRRFATAVGLNCLSAVEAIGSCLELRNTPTSCIAVSIAFRLLKRLVGRQGQPHLPRVARVSIAFRLLKRLVAARACRRTQSPYRSLNCLSAVEAIGSGRRTGRQAGRRPPGLNCLSAVEAIGSDGDRVSAS